MRPRHTSRIRSAGRLAILALAPLLLGESFAATPLSLLTPLPLKIAAMAYVNLGFEFMLHPSK